MSLYQCGERVIQKLKKRRGSIKNLVFAEKYKSPKQLYALVCETLKYSEAIEEVLVISKFRTNRLSKEQVLLLIYDFLFGKGIRCGGKLKQHILNNKSQLKSALVRLKIKRGVSSNKALISEDKNVKCLPKYLRVNTLKTTLATVVQQLTEDGFVLIKEDRNLKAKEFRIDGLVDNLLMFHERTDFHANQLYLDGHIIFQDKASCVPAQVLSPQSDCDVIDACSAPGNKTSLLAATMNNTGRIFAFDLDRKRLATMDKLLHTAGVTNCQTKQQDFLLVSPNDTMYSDVKYLLVDPSCSGSGIVNRLSSLTDSTQTPDHSRLEALAEFQLKILNHALSFPKAEKVVYSTCSVHDIENELVVQNVLFQNPNFVLEKCLPQWARRGHAISGFEKDSEKCLRFEPDDKTNGFFVALFCRKNVNETKPVKKKRKNNKSKRVKKIKLGDS